MKPITMKPSKQRRRLYQAPSHERRKAFSAPLSSELKEKYGARSFSIKKGDSVRILRGDFKGLEGKVVEVDRKKYQIHVEGITREKVDGSTVFVPIHPSKVMITSLNLDDKWRKRALGRRSKGLVELKEAAEAGGINVSP